jgi:hypothetical protein
MLFILPWAVLLTGLLTACRINLAGRDVAIIAATIFPYDPLLYLLGLSKCQEQGGEGCRKVEYALGLE